MRFLFLILLLLILVGAAYLLLKKRWRGFGWALGVFLLVVLVGIWAIFQSRSSTASIGTAIFGIPLPISTFLIFNVFIFPFSMLKY